MNRAVSRVLPSLLSLVALAACGTAGTGAAKAPQAAATSAQQSTASAAPGGGLPPDPRPTNDGPCPYLATPFVAEANGQRVPKVMTSADQPHPTCFFYANAKDVQLTVRVYVGDPATAKTVVDKAAPVADSSPAKAPQGWDGGSLVTPDGAVYAVAKAGTAVVVTSNQQQTIKARRIAETVVENLNLG
jgi:UPF0176 protein